MSRPQFSDDNPKENPWTEDRLGFAPFAKRLADSIREVDAPNGYVIGLQGAWGSGKSTALNFVQAIIQKHNDELAEGQKSIHVIDFRPWIVSGHQDLIESFFKIITEQLADQKDAWTKHGKAGLRTLRKNVDPVVDAAAAIGSILAPGIGTLGGIGIKLATEAAKKTGASKLDDWLAEPSLQSAYEKLRKRIVEQDEKFLVIIDDIDRLTDDEIRTIMQMVKTLGRLPNVVYLLAYDRNIVWPALDKRSKREDDKPSFAEKIIQQEVELPRPSKNALFKMLDLEIGFLTEQIPTNERWHRLVMDGLQTWIKHPRDVARLANAIKFTWPAIEDEVDRQDVVAIEGIRLFEPILFEWIRDSRHYFFGSSDWSMATDHGKRKVFDEFNLISGKYNHERWARLLTLLIPSMYQVFEKNGDIFGLTAEPYYSTSNRRGVGSEAGYSAYFSLHASSDTVPVKTINSVLDKENTHQTVIGIMRGMLVKQIDQERPLIGDFIQDIRNRIYAENYSSVPEGLFKALFYMGGDIQLLRQDHDMFVISPSSNLDYLLADMCKLINVHRLTIVLNDVFDNINSLSYFSEFWVRRAEERNLIARGGDRRQPAVPEDLLENLHEKLRARIIEAIKDKTIDNEPFYMHIAEVIAFQNREAFARDWISRRSLESGAFLAKLCRGLLSYSRDIDTKSYFMHEIPPEKIYDISALHLAANKHADDDDLDKDDLSKINALKKGLEKILAGESKDKPARS